MYFYLKNFLGPPSSVVDLIVQHDLCSTLIQWEPPYVLPGLSITYNVTIINGETINNITNSTNFTSNYCFDGDYCVNVMTFSGAIIGESTLNHSRGTLHQNGSLDCTFLLESILAEKDISVEKQDKYWIYRFNATVS